MQRLLEDQMFFPALNIFFNARLLQTISHLSVQPLTITRTTSEKSSKPLY
jgi:hypothetical protein